MEEVDDHLKDLLAIQTEVESAELYRGQPLFAELDAHLQSRGFLLFDLLPVRSYRFTGNRSHAYLRRHLNISTNSAQGFFQLGLVQLSMNQFQAAAATFQAALRAKPDFGPAWFNYGYALARAGNVREAIGPFREAIRHNPEHTDSYLLLADLHLQLNERERASQLIGQARMIDPNNPRLPAIEKKLGPAPR